MTPCESRASQHSLLREEKTMTRTMSAPKSVTCLLVTLVALLLLESPLAAQYTTANLGGTVADASGGTVPDARVTVRNTETGFTQTTVSGASGAFVFPRLPVGSYELRVEKEGFATYVQSGIRLAVDQAANVSVALQVGQVSNEVTVTGEAELVSSRTATGGQVVSQVPIVELPLNGRRPERLMYLAAGTVDLGRNSCRICGNGGVYPGEETPGVNGNGQGQVNFQMDGADHNDTYLNTSLPFPNPDSVQEFSLLSSNFTAEYGNAAGGIVNIVSRSGTNEIHGSLFEFLRNGKLNARQYFAGRTGSIEAQPVRGQCRRPDRKGQALLLRHLPGYARAQRAQRTGAVCTHAGAAERRLFLPFHTIGRPGFRRRAAQQPDTSQPLEPGFAVFSEQHPPSQRPQWAVDLSGRSDRAD